MTETQTLIRKIKENVAKYGKENNTTFLMIRAIDALHKQEKQLQANTAIPAGFKLVPIEPTQSMEIAGQNAHYKAENKSKESGAWEEKGFARPRRITCANYVYAAMLAAAPNP